MYNVYREHILKTFYLRYSWGKANTDILKLKNMIHIFKSTSDL